MFKDFQRDILNVLDKYNFGLDNVIYVSLTPDFYINIYDFMALDHIPKIWKDNFFSKEQFGTWRIPLGFRIVLYDYSFIEYDVCFNPFLVNGNIINL